MSKVKLNKLSINICAGGSGDPLNKASKVLEELTGQQPRYTKSRLTVRSFGIRRNEKIACCATVRGEKAMGILKRALLISGNKLPESKFSESGIFSFGISEHIDLGMKYDPSIGIIGMHFSVQLARPGYRVKMRKHKKSKIGAKQKVSRTDAIEWFNNNGFKIAE